MFDVLLPAKQHAFPILLPQPPAYPPSLFPSAELALRLAAPSTFVTTSSPTSTTTVNDTDLSHLVALSSCNYPLINLLTSQASEGTLLGRHNISDAVNERLPLLIESGADSSTQDSSRSAQPTSPNPSVSPHTLDNISSRSISAPGDAPLPTQGRGTFDWWKWVSVFAVFFMTGTIVRVGWLRVRRWRARRAIKVDLGKAVKGEVRGELASAERVVVPVLEKAVTVDGAQTSIPEVKTDPSVDAATPLLAAPVTPASSKAEQSRLPAMSPGQESDELPQRTGKKRRRKRGKGKGKGVRAAGEDGGESEEDDEAGGEAMSPGQGKNGLLLEALVPLEPVDGAVVAERTATKRKDAVQKMDGLTVSDDVLGMSPRGRTRIVADLARTGYGSQGTVVFKGVFQGRAVAVKRLVADHFSIASQEVSLLQASDDHQNVVRCTYPRVPPVRPADLCTSDYYQEQREMFLYIALELCPASLADIIDSPQRHQELASAFNPKKAMFQVTAGLKHLHGLKIIHRDLKPQWVPDLFGILDRC